MQEKKLMEYDYLSEEERRYHQDILDATQKTIDRFQKDPNFKIERKRYCSWWTNRLLQIILYKILI